MRRPSAPPRSRPPDAETAALLEQLRGVRDRELERASERHTRDPAPAREEPRQRARTRERPRPDRAAAAPRDEAIPPGPEVRGTGPVLPVPWTSERAPSPEPSTPTPPPPLEHVPPETVTSDPAIPPRSFEPPRGYYTPAEPPPPPAPPPASASPAPPPMSPGPQYTFGEALRIAAGWEQERARARARRRLEFYQRYGTPVPVTIDGPDGTILIAPDARPPRDPDEVAREVILGTWELIQEGSGTLTGLSEELRESSLEAADDIHVLFDPLRAWIREHRVELNAAELVLGVSGLGDLVLELIDFLQNALSALMGIGTGVLRAGLELLPGIISLLELLYNGLQLLLLEDIARAEAQRERFAESGGPLPGAALLPLEMTPGRRRLLEERRRWARELRDGIARAVDEWKAEYEAAGPDRRANMIGQIIGQIIALLVTARAAGPRAATGGGGGTAAATAESAPGVLAGAAELGAEGAAVARPGIALPGAAEAAERLGLLLEQLGPPPALAGGAAVLMSTPDGGSPTGPAPPGPTETARGTGAGVRGTASRHPSPPRRRIPRAARRRLQDRLTAVETQARLQVRLLRELEEIRREINATYGHEIPDMALWRRLRAREAELLRRLGRRELGRGPAAARRMRARTERLLGFIRELRRSARALDLDDAALRAVEDLDLADHLAISTPAEASSGGHFRGVPVEHELSAALDLSPLDSAAVRRTRSGVINNPAGSIGERIGQRTADPVTRAWARAQARRLGHTGEPVRGRLYAYTLDESRGVYVRTEIGDPGAFAAADGDRLSLLVYAEAKTSRDVAAGAVARQTEAALTRARGADFLEFVADDGRVLRASELSAGEHTMLVTHGVRDGTVLDYTGRVPGGLGAHRHNAIPLTYDQVRDLASHYSAATPEPPGGPVAPPARPTGR